MFADFRRSNLGWVILLSSVALIGGCKSTTQAKPAGAAVSISAPLGLPPVPVPPDNPPTMATIALGRRLFYDTRLSKDDSLSCASCHQPQHRFSDDRERSLGVSGTLGRRHAPSLVNAAYSSLYFWDGRAQSLEDQVGGPIADPLEMNQSHDASVAKLQGDSSYRPMFKQAFGSEEITMKRVENALASFERTILVGNSPFDRYEYLGQKDALTPAQKRGLAIFRDPIRGNCVTCHAIGPHYASFSDGEFHNTGEGVGDNDELSDQGRFAVTKLEADRGKFKTPQLRNVAVGGPYMHDGKLKTLKDVVDFYAGRGNSNPNLDTQMSNINLSGQDRRDLIEFLESLTGENPRNVGPPGKDSSQ